MLYIKPLIVLFFVISASSYAKHQRYIDFEVNGLAMMENHQRDNKNDTGSIIAPSNILIDFNFNENIGISTSTSLSNRKNSINSPHILKDFINNNIDVEKFFNNQSLTSRIFALSIHNKKTEVLLGKIRPNVSAGSTLSGGLFNTDWHGAFGTLINTGYVNSNKIGAQIHSNMQLTNNSQQIFEIALFKNDTSKTNDSLFSNTQTFGNEIPRNLSSILNNKQIAGDTKIPSSFSILFINKLDQEPKNSTIVTSVFIRQQAVDKKYASFARNENSYFIANQYNKHIQHITIGAFAEYGLIQNAHGIAKRIEQFTTASIHTSFEKFIIALVHNIYTANKANNLGIENTHITQTQASVGYKFQNNLRADIGIRKITDKKTNRSVNGIGTTIFYNFGTMYDSKRIIPNII